MASNPLPKAGSGYFFDTNALQTGYGVGAVRRARDWSSYLFDMGLKRDMSPDHSNPFSQLAQISKQSQDASTAAGWGASGRAQQLSAEQPRFAAFRGAQNQMNRVQDEELDSRFALNEGMAQAARKAALFGIDNKTFTTPDMTKDPAYQAKGGVR